MELFWYSRVLAHHPCFVIITIFILSAISFIIPLCIKSFPDFSDPQLGFEARGTPLAQRIVTWKNLIDSTSSKRYFVDNPLEYYYYLQEINLKNKDAHLSLINPTLLKNDDYKNHTKAKQKQNKGKFMIKKQYQIGKENASEEKLNLQSEGHKSIKNNRSSNYSKQAKKHKTYSTDDFFCNVPSPAYARVVISSRNERENLWSVGSLLAQCHIDSTLRSNPKFLSLCQRKLRYKKKCCLSWSPANYVALLSNKTSCLTLTEADLTKVEKLLRACFYFYQNLELTIDCTENLRCQQKVPATCYAYNAVYYLLHYLLDLKFVVNNNTTNSSSLDSVMIILPIAASSASLDYYEDIKFSHLNYKSLYVSAVQLGLKNTLFDKLLISDSFLILVGFGFITLCIWFYTGSFLITISTILVVIFSLVISYAIYTLVLKIVFFPFMNLLTIIVAVGIGADDAFIYCKVWECSKRRISSNSHNGLVNLVHETIKHAVPSIFVTTLTTSVAFFSSIISNVTAINCFSLFSGIIVIINFLLMLTWLPASIIIAEKCRMQIMAPEKFFIKKIIQPMKIFIYKITYTFVNLLILVVISLKWFWCILFFSLGIASCCIVFKYPGLQLPDSQEFQLFDRSHLFEQYDLIYTQHFGFEKNQQDDNNRVLPLRFIWGVLPVDNGNYLNPSSKGDLIIDESFNISDPKSQIWLQNFCKNLRLQSFYRSTLGPLLPNCFIESVRNWMERRCEDPLDSKINRSPCCEQSSFPYQPKVLNRCTAEAVAEIYRTPSHLWNFKSSKDFQTTGVKFFNQNTPGTFDTAIRTNGTGLSISMISEIKVVIVEYDSNFQFSMSFSEMNNFYNQVETWMQAQLSTAPDGMKNGWFVSDLEFFELQRTLYEGTIWSIIVSMVLAFFVLTFVTFNPLISFFAILSTGATIIITIAGLTIIGWKLNVLESIAISTAIGLAVDFNLHYGVSYRLNTARDRVERVKKVLEQMTGPTMMAALTTGAAGAFMLPSQVLPYIQIGIFLIWIMGISWIYATFFFCSILSICGPIKFIRINCSRSKDASFDKREKKKMTRSKNISIGRSSEGVVEETNLNTEGQLQEDSALPEFANVFLFNADIHHIMSNNQRSDFNS